MKLEQKVDASFIAPFLVEDTLLDWEPGSNACDLTKKTLHVLRIVKEDPKSLRVEDVAAMVKDKKSQIQNESYLHHIVNVARINRQLVEKISSKVPSLDLPDPGVAWVWGLVHDLSKIYARTDFPYANHDNELTLYFHARHLGINNLAKHVSLHSAYFEILDMIMKGSGFKGVELYDGWREVLGNDANMISYKKIKESFRSHINGNDNLPLHILTTADYLDNGKPFSEETFEQDFRARMNDIVQRHFLNKIYEGKQPTALGIALVQQGGLERNLRSKKIVYDHLIGIHENNAQGIIKEE